MTLVGFRTFRGFPPPPAGRASRPPCPSRRLCRAPVLRPMLQVRAVLPASAEVPLPLSGVASLRMALVRLSAHARLAPPRRPLGGSNAPSGVRAFSGRLRRGLRRAPRLPRPGTVGPFSSRRLLHHAEKAVSSLGFHALQGLPSDRHGETAVSPPLVHFPPHARRIAPMRVSCGAPECQ
jgi:hypothetical protein